MDNNCTLANMECTCKTNSRRFSTIKRHHVVKKIPTACIYTSPDNISSLDKKHSIPAPLRSCAQGRRRSSAPTHSIFHQSPVKMFFTTLLIHLSLSPCSSYQTSDNKNPLLSTDETNRQDFRYFLPSLGEITSRSSFTHRPNVGDLDFQTLKVIKQWGNDTRDVLLVSGSDYVYMLNSTLSPNNSKQISYIERLTWRTPVKTERECRMMGKKKYECKNFIRVIELLENGELMVCGTNAYAPSCRYYKREQFNGPASGENSAFNSETVCRDQCVVPYNPATASTTLYTETDNGYQTFAAVVGEFSSNDPIILRKESPTLYSNSLWLNDPTFLKMFEYEDKIYVFFREIAKESESGDKHTRYSRVAQICKNDQGGVNVLSQQWTSFLKARLRCGRSGENRLVFNNLTSVSDVVSVKDESGKPMDVIFGTFTTPWGWAPGSISAVCMFSLEGIKHVFEEGSFLEEYELNAKPLKETNISPVGGTFSAQANMKKIERSFAVPRNEVPTPRPGSCSKRYSPDVLFFAKEHPLMHDSVEPHFNEPIFFQMNLRATQISVDSNAGEQGETMLYIGTEDGRILRVRAMLSRTEGQKSYLLEDIPVTGKCKCKNCGVLSLHVSRQSSKGRSSVPSIFVAFSNCMVQFPLLRCNLYKSSECCSVDPNCGYDHIDSTCIERTSENSMDLISTLNENKEFPTLCKTAGETDGGRNMFLADDTRVNCECNNKIKQFDENSKNDFTIDSEILRIIGMEPIATGELRNILTESVLPVIQQQFRITLESLKDESQRGALKKQLKEAIVSTTNLVLKNHMQEYCLPSPTINHLTHVYPLLLREIENWHQTAIKKMNVHGFENKCWGKGRTKCTVRESFSIPLVPVLWEPLTKLIADFGGECETIVPPGIQPEGIYEDSQRGCVPRMETCHDARHPHCHPKRCRFSKYAVDVRAFFRHANDSRQFLASGDAVEPLWKPVNVSLTNTNSVRGHLELVVSEHQPFVIDYSPVAEKVKIIFQYSAVRDCALTEPMCAGMAHGCNPDVEEVADNWFRVIMRRMTPRLRQCAQELDRVVKRQKREGLNSRASIRDRSPWLRDLQRSDANIIVPTPVRCRRVSIRRRAVSKDIWPLIIRRSQRSGGVYSADSNSRSARNEVIEFYKLEDVIRFFKNMCTFGNPTTERSTFKRRNIKGASHSKKVFIQAYVTPETPFVIQKTQTGVSQKIYFKFFKMEA